MRKAHEKDSSEEQNTAEFNHIYSNLVHKIKNRIDRAELPAINKKEDKGERMRER